MVHVALRRDRYAVRTPGNLPRRLSPGELPNHAWINRLLDWLVANRLQSTPTVRVSSLRGGGGIGAHVSGGSASGRQTSVVTHRTTLAGSTTLNGRADLTRTEAQLKADTALGTAYDFSTSTYASGWVETEVTRTVYNYDGDETFYGYARDVEYDGQGRKCSASQEMRYTIDAPEGC